MNTKAVSQEHIVYLKGIRRQNRTVSFFRYFILIAAMAL